NEVELTRLVLGPGEMRSGRSITAHHADLIEQSTGWRRLDPKLDRLFRRLFRIVVSAEGPIGKGEVREWKRMSRTTSQRLLRFRDRALVSSKTVVNQRERVGRAEVARISAFPDYQRSRRLVLVAGHPVVVLIRDEQALALADPPFDVVRQTRELLTSPPFPD